MLACAYSMIWIMFIPMGDAGGHRLESPSLFMWRGTASVEGKQNILPTPQTYWPDSTIFTEWFGTSHFSLSVLVRTRRCCLPRSNVAAGSSWKQLAFTNVSRWSTSCWLCWISFKSCSVFGPSAFVFDLALLLLCFLRGRCMWVEMQWQKTVLHTFFHVFSKESQ